MNRTVAINEFGLRIGEDHHNAKYSDAEVERVRFLRDAGVSYLRIVRICGMPKSVVRDICTARRRCQCAAGWKKVEA